MPTKEYVGFIKTIFGGVKGSLELRALPSGDRVFTRAFSEVTAFCDRHAGENLYFGVATRKEDCGSRYEASLKLPLERRPVIGGKSDGLYLPGLWVDLDFKSHIGEIQAEKMIAEGPLKPSIIVYSGNGVHLYFLFKEARAISEKGIPKIEALLRRLAEYYQGDTACADVARILRLPGTRNQKYSPPRDVILVEMNDEKYCPEDFKVYGKAVEETRKNPEGWDKELVKGVGEGLRNESAAKLAGKYYTLGLARGEILDLLQSWNERNEPPLPTKDLEIVVDSIGRRHRENHPTVLESLPSLSLSDWEQALSDLRYISKEGLKSGYKKLDPAIGGVWRDGIVFSGEPGGGKSILSLNLAVRFAGRGNRVILFDLENDRRDIIKRLVLIILTQIMGSHGAPTENGLIGEGQDLPKIEAYKPTMQAYFEHITVFSVGDHKVTPKTLDGWMRLASEEVGRSKKQNSKGEESGKQAILFIDSINELASAYPLMRGTYESLERWLSAIKGLRVKYQIPVCLICHVPKDTQAEIFNPKGSSGIAHFARTQIIVKKTPRPTKFYDEVAVEIVRSQFGPGRERGIGFALDKGRLNMEEGGGNEEKS